jgi:hypothetical protein
MNKEEIKPMTVIQRANKEIENLTIDPEFAGKVLKNQQDVFQLAKLQHRYFIRKAVLSSVATEKSAYENQAAIKIRELAANIEFIDYLNEIIKENGKTT